MATPQILKTKKNVKTVLSKNCFQNAQKCVFLGVILQSFPRGMPPEPPRMVVPSALPLKLICDVTRLWWHLSPPRKFSAHATDAKLTNNGKLLPHCPAKTYLALWTLFSNTEKCANSSGAGIRWGNSHWLISASFQLTCSNQCQMFVSKRGAEILTDYHLNVCDLRVKSQFKRCYQIKWVIEHTWRKEMWERHLRTAWRFCSERFHVAQLTRN